MIDVDSGGNKESGERKFAAEVTDFEKISASKKECSDTIGLDKTAPENKGQKPVVNKAIVEKYDNQIKLGDEDAKFEIGLKDPDLKYPENKKPSGIYEYITYYWTLPNGKALPLQVTKFKGIGREFITYEETLTATLTPKPRKSFDIEGKWKLKLELYDRAGNELTAELDVKVSKYPDTGSSGYGPVPRDPEI